MTVKNMMENAAVRDTFHGLKSLQKLPEHWSEYEVSVQIIQSGMYKKFIFLHVKDEARTILMTPTLEKQLFKLQFVRA
jgi:hypothetical protein